MQRPALGLTSSSIHQPLAPQDLIYSLSVPAAPPGNIKFDISDLGPLEELVGREAEQLIKLIGFGEPPGRSIGFSCDGLRGCVCVCVR